MRKRILYSNLLFLVLAFAFLLPLVLTAFSAFLNRAIETGVVAAGQGLTKQAELGISNLMSQHLRGIAEKALQLAGEQYQRQVAGIVRENEAKQGLLRALAAQKIGRSGYVFVLTSKGFVELHPEQHLVGKEIEQIEQFRTALPLNNTLRTSNSGYLEYDWQPEHGADNRPKSLYFEMFRPWDFIIAVTGYRDELLDILKPEAINSLFSSFRYGHNGHGVLLDSQGQMLSRPYEQDADNAKLADLMAKIARREDGASPHVVSFNWGGPNETKQRARLLYTQPMPRLGLVAGIIADRDELIAELLTRDTIFRLLLVGAGLLAVLGTALFLSRRIAAPIGRLASEMRAPGQDAPPYAGGCEVDFLLDRFTRSLDALNSANERARSELLARQSAEYFLEIYKQIFDNATEGMVITDAGGKILAVNSAFTNITGYALHELLGGDPRILKSDRNAPALYQNIWQQLKDSGSWEGELWVKRKNGAFCPIWLTINAIRNKQKMVLCFFASCSEIGELKKKEKQIAFMAFHDMLTRLPNRAFLEQRLARSIARIQGEGGKMALFFIDLDNFKNVNDVFGHNFGDDLLVEVSKRFSSVLGANDSLYRLGSDEFILLMDCIENDSGLYLMANRIQAILKKPFRLDFKKIYVNASIGIAVFPGDGENGLEIIRSADMAMHRVKNEGKNRYLLFTKEMHAELYERFRIETNIRYGLLNKEFVVFYQPKVNVLTRTTSSLEALIRWRKGNQLISPGVFIPIAEESSLIDDLCMYVMEETCAFHQLMAEHGLARPISVNISPRQFHNADFIDLVEDLLGRYKVEPKYLEFEITETTAMSNVENTLLTMARIREIGICFSIDDFGTGYSSLGYLNRMPVSTLKIDKEFVQDMDRNSGLVATIIAISQQMHLNVVAEGVETEEQLLKLAAMGCHEVQGYYFSRPIDANQTLRYLEAERSAHSVQ